MGLDMYLDKHVWIGAQYEHSGVKVEINIQEKGADDTYKQININPNRVSEIVERIGYWRKANQIHNWFVNNVQDGNDNCQNSYVSIEDLENLKQLCVDVLADHKKAKKLLPTTDGFFFGSTDYDEYYFQDLEETIKIIDIALADKNAEYYYHASW